MTPEAQRIAIAEACGWERWRSSSGKVVLLIPRDEAERDSWIKCGDVRSIDPVNWWRTTQPVPDYLSDLNACHEMEKVLTEAQRHVYLYKHLGAAHYPQLFDVAHATAPQRCEAFLKTLNLWDDTK